MAPVEAPEIVQPTSEVELARVLADAARRGLKVAPRGGGTKSDWGCPPERVDLVLLTLGLTRVLEHAAGDMTATVEAGCTIAALQQVLAQHGQRLALDPLWPDRATVGGVLATNDSGPLRHAFGTARDLLLGVTVALPDGTLARSGGKVVKNVAGYDLPKLMIAAYGTLGVITQATFRLHPLPRQTRTHVFAAQSFAQATRFVGAVRASTLAVSGLQLSAGHDLRTTVAVRVEGSAVGVESSAAPLAQRAAACGLASVEATDDPWARRERLWQSPGTVTKITFPPSQLPHVCASMPRAPWALVAQATGTGLVATSAAPDDIIELADRLRATDGSLTVLRGDAPLKRHVNAAALTGVLPLMKRVKQQFDPTATLNPGRLGGGI
jgi:glycolate oxidase FAD binding subunit